MISSLRSGGTAGLSGSVKFASCACGTRTQGCPGYPMEESGLTEASYNSDLAPGHPKIYPKTSLRQRL